MQVDILVNLPMSQSTTTMLCQRQASTLFVCLKSHAEQQSSMSVLASIELSMLRLQLLTKYHTAVVWLSDALSGAGGFHRPKPGLVDQGCCRQGPCQEAGIHGGLCPLA